MTKLFKTILALPLLALLAGTALGDIATLDHAADQETMLRQVAEQDRRLKANPKDARAYLARGEAHFKLRDFESAVEDFTRAIRLNDKLDDAYFGRGMARGRGGEIDAGIADLGVYLRRNPRSSLAYTKRGIRYIWKGDLENAERDFRQALKLDPKNAEAHDDLGVILAQRGEYDAALRHFQATISADPTYQKGYHNLALVHYLTGNPTEGLKRVDQALLLIPEARDSLLLKAAILESLGRTREANTIKEDAEFLPQGDASARLPLQ